MDVKEYNKRLTDLEREFEVKKNQLAKECAISNNTYKVGDTVTDHIGSIKIESIGFSYGRYGKIPYSVYNGPVLTKKGVPKKTGEYRKVYGCNVEG